MRKTFQLLGFILLSAPLFAQQKVDLKTPLDSVSYGYGMTVGANLKKILDKDANLTAFLAGLNAVVNGAETKLTMDEGSKRFNEYNTKVAQPRISARWKDDNTKFLEENKKRQGVVTTASGLQYEVLKQGAGTVSPKATDRVEVHYHGTLFDGTIFDSSVQRNKTATFGLNQVIPGWTEGLQYMKEGDKFRFYIPYNLAYGEQARGAIIKGFSTLIFDVELFKVNP